LLLRNKFFAGGHIDEKYVLFFIEGEGSFLKLCCLFEQNLRKEPANLILKRKIAFSMLKTALRILTTIFTRNSLIERKGTNQHEKCDVK
jgi:hypothetical protein